jgi:hypothetical protein
VSQYRYGTINAGEEWEKGWQKGWVCSPESKTIVLDEDGPEFWETLASLGITNLPDTLTVQTGREGGKHYVFDGRHLALREFPGQKSFSGGDLKANGFVAAPGSTHPSGKIYKIVNRRVPAPWRAEWTEKFGQAPALKQSRAAKSGEASSGGGGGFGRNDYLTRRKGIYVARGLTEEQANERVVADNTRLPEPLSDQELHTTVLRPKGWERQPVCPGHSVIPEEREEDNSVAEEKVSDLPECRPITTLPQLKRKVEAEADPHPLSVDWAAAPPGTQEFYEDLAAQAARALMQGEHEARCQASLRGKFGAQLAWLLHGNGAPLVEHVKGNVWRLLKDPEGPKQNPYPGVPEGQEPRWTKKHVGRRLAQLVYLIRSDMDGASLTNREVAEVLNNQVFRRLFMIEDCCYISAAAVSKAQVKLRAEHAGGFRRVSSAVHYRDQHRWRLDQPARWRTGLDISQCELGEMITPVIRHVLEEMQRQRRGMELMQDPMGRAA